MDSFVFNTTPRLVIRPGSARELAQLSAMMAGARSLFVTDRGIREHRLDVEIIAALEKAGVDVSVFDAVKADPSRATLDAAIEAARISKATHVIGFGGGSSLDIAKLVALIAGSGENLDEAWGLNNARGPRLPLVLVPTTAGTGSEVTPVAIITVGAEEKRGVSSPVLLPDLAILDADLTLTVPPAITAATGIDAMVHAIEAFTSASRNNNPLSRILAVEALQLLGRHIEQAVFTPKDLGARSGMLFGACLAGMAFANSPVAAVHALAYPIGGQFKVAHGLSNALVLPHVLRFNADDPSNGAALAYGRLAPHLFDPWQSSDEPASDAHAFADRLADLCFRLGLPTRLRDVGIPESALAAMAADAMKQTRLLVNNPRPMTQKDALAIYRAAW